MPRRGHNLVAAGFPHTHKQVRRICLPGCYQTPGRSGNLGQIDTIEPKIGLARLFIGTVAGYAMFGQNRAHIAVKIHGCLGRTARKKHDSEHDGCSPANPGAATNRKGDCIPDQYFAVVAYILTCLLVQRQMTSANSTVPAIKGQCPEFSHDALLGSWQTWFKVRAMDLRLLHHHI
jgi:hypothetical protein